MTRLSFTAPDGTETEFRDLNGGGDAQTGVCPSYTGNDPNGFNRGRVFVSVDGSGATFIASSNIYDPVGTNTSPESLDISGWLLLRDGTRYLIGNGLVSLIQDRNGNQISFTYDGNLRVSTLTDSLNRQVTIAYDVAEGGQYGTCDKITYKGFGGADRVIRISKTNLGSALCAQVIRCRLSLPSSASMIALIQCLTRLWSQPSGCRMGYASISFNTTAMVSWRGSCYRQVGLSSMTTAAVR